MDLLKLNITGLEPALMATFLANLGELLEGMGATANGVFTRGYRPETGDSVETVKIMNNEFYRGDGSDSSPYTRLDGEQT